MQPGECRTSKCGSAVPQGTPTGAAGRWVWGLHGSLYRALLALLSAAHSANERQRQRNKEQGASSLQAGEFCAPRCGSAVPQGTPIGAAGRWVWGLHGSLYRALPCPGGVSKGEGRSPPLCAKRGVGTVASPRFSLGGPGGTFSFKREYPPWLPDGQSPSFGTPPPAGAGIGVYSDGQRLFSYSKALLS